MTFISTLFIPSCLTVTNGTHAVIIKGYQSQINDFHPKQKE